jgi:hypothetical protein
MGLDKFRFGLGGYYNFAETNGYIRTLDNSGNIIQRQHYLYALADYSVIRNLSAGLQVGTTLLQETGQSAFIMKPIQMSLGLSARVSFNVPINQQFAVGALVMISYFLSSQNPAAGIANHVYASFDF